MLPPLLADHNVARSAVAYLRTRGVDVVSCGEQGWGRCDDTEILRRARQDSRFVLTHDSDFGKLAIFRGEPIVGILFLRPGGRPPEEVIADLEQLLAVSVDWRPPLIAVYRSGRLRLRRLQPSA